MALSDILRNLPIVQNFTPKSQNQIELERLAIEEARKKLNEEKERPFSDLLRPQTEPQFRKTFDLPFGPMTEPQTGAYDFTASMQSKIPQAYMGFKPSEFQKTTGGIENLMPKTPAVTPGEWDRRFQKQTEAINNRQENRVDESVIRRKQSTIDKFNADPSVRKAQQSIDSAGDIEQMAISGNPIGAASIPTFMARASGEVGNLSEADKAPFGGSRAIFQRIQATAKELANGQLSEDNKNFILGLTAIMKKRGIEKKQTLAKIRSKQYSKINGLGTEQELFSMFYPDDELSPDMGGGQTGGNTGGSRLTPEQRRARIAELKAKMGQ